MPTHADQHREAALATAQQRLLDGWRDVSSRLRKLAQSLGHAQSCACGVEDTDLPGRCRCGVSAETEHECLQCAVLLHTIAWRIDELLDGAPPFRPAGRDILSEFGAIESAARMDTLRGLMESLARTFAQIDTLTRESSRECSAARLPVIRRLADDLLVRCSALDEVLGFPRASSGRR
jgi:hypothetical protein